MTGAAGPSGVTVGTPLDGPPPTPFGEFDLGVADYVRTEHLLSATATSYRNVGEWDTDGAWTAEPEDQIAVFTTRLVVHQPLDAARFNGTVVVEWLNVSAGRTSRPGGCYAPEIVRSGAAYVGVSAQRAGIDGGGLVPGPHLKMLDAERYAPLAHPGDAFAFDIFIWAARVVREGPPLLPRAPERQLAWGHSQSAVFLVTYINAVDAHAAVIRRVPRPRTRRQRRSDRRAGCCRPPSSPTSISPAPRHACRRAIASAPTPASP